MGFIKEQMRSGISAILGGQKEGPYIAYSLPERVRANVAGKNKANVPGLKEIAGVDPVLKKYFGDLLFALQHPSDVKGRGFRTILLKGPPGVQKSLLVEGLAKDSGSSAVLFDPNVESAEQGFPLNDPASLYESIYHRSVEIEDEDNKKRIKNKLLGMSDEPERTLIVFLDEVDRFFLRRQFGDDTQTSEAITWWNKLKAERENIWIIGTTNLDTNLDDAIFSRFRERKEVNPPGGPELIDLLMHFIGKLDYDAKQDGRDDLFETDLRSGIRKYRQSAKRFSDYVTDYYGEHGMLPDKGDSHGDKLLEDLSAKGDSVASQLDAIATAVLGKTRTDTLTHRDVDEVMTDLAQQHGVNTAIQNKRNENGRDKVEVEPISVKDIRIALLTRKKQNQIHKAKVKEAEAQRSMGSRRRVA